jgi:hypothetical protein
MLRKRGLSSPWIRRKKPDGLRQLINVRPWLPHRRSKSLKWPTATDKLTVIFDYRMQLQAIAPS